MVLRGISCGSCVTKVKIKLGFKLESGAASKSGSKSRNEGKNTSRSHGTGFDITSPPFKKLVQKKSFFV